MKVIMTELTPEQQAIYDKAMAEQALSCAEFEMLMKEPLGDRYEPVLEEVFKPWSSSGIKQAARNIIESFEQGKIEGLLKICEHRED